MKIYHQISEFKKPSNAIVTIGSFDGVHKGHQKILKRMAELAKENEGETVVMTFWPHPRAVLSPANTDLKVLSTIQEKTALLERYGAEHLLIVPFTKEFSEISPEDFIGSVLVKAIGTKKLVVGYDHKFGRQRSGDFDYLKARSSEYNFQVEEISREDVKNMAVSSSTIRESLLKGDVRMAADFLGHYYELSGEVAEGRMLGRTIGFPTANIECPEPGKLIPADGVYAVLVEVSNEIHWGMLNIGLRPTVNGHRRKIEVHIFDFSSDIYHEQIVVRFVERLRDEIKFPDLEALKIQLYKDKKLTESVLSNIKL